MNALPADEPLSIPRILAAKGRERIAMMTAYDAPTAALLDAAGVDVLLVGDSLEMAVYGEPNTLTATMDAMIRHTRAVSRAAKRALVVGDMPFLSYQAEIGTRRRERGPLPRRGRRRGGQGRGRTPHPPGGRRHPGRRHPRHGTRRPDAAVLPQVRRLQGAGPRGRLGAARSATTRRRSPTPAASRSCSSASPTPLAAEITARDRRSRRSGSAPARPATDRCSSSTTSSGLTRDLRPKFVRRYADLSTVIADAARAFTRDVKSGAFPIEGGVLHGRQAARCAACIDAASAHRPPIGPGEAGEPRAGFG